ncbi:hypothetical protein JG687_00013607 [Phytophthora cactorum]|uniref:Uncharacterized protein n=1 Tax=Phytophthora cactorum TaxID=29920 RepID=A0A8T1TYH3_9STRA|nr:hypothetical protein GQ600_17406 [Phytophthora cactorum]KAG6951448.1 hypothetical protein JG687_00013607 [Phytophthora cactorum]
MMTIVLMKWQATQPKLFKNEVTSYVASAIENTCVRTGRGKRPAGTCDIFAPSFVIGGSFVSSSHDRTITEARVNKVKKMHRIRRD